MDNNDYDNDAINNTINNGNVIRREVGWRWKRVRISDLSAAMTEDEMPRLSNILHRDWGGNDVNKEANYNDGAQLNGGFPATTTAVSSTIPGSLFSWLHSTANDD